MKTNKIEIGLVALAIVLFPSASLSKRDSSLEERSSVVLDPKYCKHNVYETGVNYLWIQKRIGSYCVDYELNFGMDEVFGMDEMSIYQPESEKEGVLTIITRNPNFEFEKRKVIISNEFPERGIPFYDFREVLEITLEDEEDLQNMFFDYLKKILQPEYKI